MLRLSLLPMGQCLTCMSGRKKAASGAVFGNEGTGDGVVSSTMHHRTDSARIADLFDTYCNRQLDVMQADNIETFCRDLQIAPDDFRILVLAYKMDAAQMGRFERTEFVRGMEALGTDSIKSLQVRLPEVAFEVQSDATQFKELYKFTFKFGLDHEEGQRILPVDMSLALWRLVFSGRPSEPPILKPWLKFLQEHGLGHVRGIPRDTWMMFLNFCDAVGDDLSAYDDTEAWPSLFDDFVEYENDRTNQNIPKVIHLDESKEGIR